jgi:hypothetical protein
LVFIHVNKAHHAANRQKRLAPLPGHRCGQGNWNWFGSGFHGSGRETPSDEILGKAILRGANPAGHSPRRAVMGHSDAPKTQRRETNSAGKF